MGLGLEWERRLRFERPHVFAGQRGAIALAGNCNRRSKVPVVGDWNGNGTAKIGFYKRIWALDYNGDGALTSAAKFYPTFAYVAGDKPFIGDWTGDGKTKSGIYRSGFWALDANGNGTYDGGTADRFIAFYGARVASRLSGGGRWVALSVPASLESEVWQLNFWK